MNQYGIFFEKTLEPRLTVDELPKGAIPPVNGTFHLNQIPFYNGRTLPTVDWDVLSLQKDTILDGSTKDKYARPKTALGPWQDPNTSFYNQNQNWLYNQVYDQAWVAPAGESSIHLALQNDVMPGTRVQVVPDYDTLDHHIPEEAFVRIAEELAKDRPEFDSSGYYWTGLDAWLSFYGTSVKQLVKRDQLHDIMRLRDSLARNPKTARYAEELDKIVPMIKMSTYGRQQVMEAGKLAPSPIAQGLHGNIGDIPSRDQRSTGQAGMGGFRWFGDAKYSMPDAAVVSTTNREGMSGTVGIAESQMIYGGGQGDIVSQDPWRMQWVSEKIVGQKTSEMVYEAIIDNHAKSLKANRVFVPSIGFISSVDITEANDGGHHTRGNLNKEHIYNGYTPLSQGQMDKDAETGSIYARHLRRDGGANSFGPTMGGDTELVSEHLQNVMRETGRSNPQALGTFIGGSEKYQNTSQLVTSLNKRQEIPASLIGTPEARQYAPTNIASGGFTSRERKL